MSLKGFLNCLSHDYHVDIDIYILSIFCSITTLDV